MFVVSRLIVVSLLCMSSFRGAISVSCRKQSGVSLSLFALSSVDFVGEAGSYCMLS